MSAIIEFVIGSCSGGPLDESRVDFVQSWLHRSGYLSICFEEPYLSMLRHCNGGVPIRRLFRTDSNFERLIEYFYHFTKYPPSDVRSYQEAFSAWSLTSDRMGLHLFPFAELFAGDMLCFDFSAGSPAKIVVWLHEESEPDCEPVTEFVASDFEAFAGMLY